VSHNVNKQLFQQAVSEV